MARKIIQIATAPRAGLGPEAWIIALCDDGSLWTMPNLSTHANARQRFDDIPNSPAQGTQEWFVEQASAAEMGCPYNRGLGSL